MYIYVGILFLLFGVFVLRLILIDRRLVEIGDHVRVYQGSSALFFLMMCGITFFVGLRGLTGIDTIHYKDFFDTNQYPEKMEIIYTKVSSFFFENGWSYTSFQLSIAIVIFTCLFIPLLRWSNNYALSMLMLYLTAIPLWTMNITRQMIAVSVVFFAITRLFGSDRKYINFIFCVLMLVIALNVHNSVVIALIGIGTAYVLGRLIKKNPSNLVIISMISAIWTLGMYVTDFGYQVLTDLAKDSLLSKYTDFVTVDSATTSFTSKGLAVFLFCLVLSGALFIIGRFGQDLMTSNVDYFCLGMLVVYVFLSASQVSWIADRIGQYMLPFVVLAATNITNNNAKNKTVKWVLLVLILTFGMLNLERVVLGNYGNIYPYQGVIR